MKYQEGGSPDLGEQLDKIMTFSSYILEKSV